MREYIAQFRILTTNLVLEEKNRKIEKQKKRLRKMQRS
jgi:hypothetical protein